MCVEGHGIIERPENPVADGEAFPPAQVHTVLFPFNDDIIDNNILKGTDVNRELGFTEVQTTKAFNTQVPDIKKGKLSVQAIDIVFAHIHIIDNEM